MYYLSKSLNLTCVGGSWWRLGQEEAEETFFVGWGGRGLNLICICDLGINSVVIVYAVRPP